LYLADAQFAPGSCNLGRMDNDRFVSLVTAACAIWNIGLAFVVGVSAYHLLKRGSVKL
jgi:hypothetical protein